MGVCSIFLDNKIIVMITVIFMVSATTGCINLEDEFENSILSFKIPENWTAVDVTSENYIAGLKPIYSTSTIITITSTDISPQGVVDGYITNYPREYPRFQVLTNKTVAVDGEEGILLVYKNTGRNDVLLIGPDYISSVVTFSKDNQTYIINSDEVLESQYQNMVEPAMNTVVKTIRIKSRELRGY